MDKNRDDGATMTKTTVRDGVAYTEEFRLSATRAQLWKALLTIISLIIGITLSIAAVGSSWMVREAERNFQLRLERELTPPRGKIYLAFREGITAHQVAAERVYEADYQQIKIDIALLKYMTAEVYTKNTGHPAPISLIAGAPDGGSR